MLEEILNYIHNYFEVQIVKGDFIIKNGSLDTATPKVRLQNGQYFRIVGSVFNDGIYKFPADGLTDEAFTGEVRAMAVPPAVVALSEEISNGMNKYGDAMNGPFQSESFGGYSYTKKSSGSGSGVDASDWRSVFGSRLNHWRKIS